MRPTRTRSWAARADWSIYPHERRSVGFSQRGCRLKCGFCVVPRKEGRVRAEATVAELWRGEPWPRDLVLLDNDFFGQPDWRDRVREIVEGGFRVSLTQGINVRLVGDEEAEALAALPYRDDSFEKRRLYCAWDNRKDEKTLFRGLARLDRAGIKRSHLMVYMLVGYDHATNGPRPLHVDDFYRARRLRDWGADVYPMPFERTPELQGFARWVCRGHEKRGVSWEDWVGARLQPRNLGQREPGQGRLFVAFGEA